MPDNHFTFSARALAALTCFTARGGGRKHLRGVRFERADGGGAIGIASDGVVLAVWRDVRSEGPDRPVMREFPRCAVRQMTRRDAGSVPNPTTTQPRHPLHEECRWILRESSAGPNIRRLRLPSGPNR